MEVVGTAHNGKNTGTTPVRMLVVNMGAEGVAGTVKLPKRQLCNASLQSCNLPEQCTN